MTGHPRQLLEGMRTVKSAVSQSELIQNVRENPSWGAAHAAEFKHLFNTHVDPIDDQIVKLMTKLWVQCDKTSDPNGEGLPDWPAYGAEREFIKPADERS